MNEHDLDLSLSQLEAIARRIQSAHDKQETLPFHSLQYWVSETGPPSVRFDPRMLQRALEELGNNQRPRRGKLSQGSWEPISRIFVSPSVGHTDSRAAAVVNADSTLKRLENLASMLTGARVPRLLPQLAASLGRDASWRLAFTTSTTWLAGDLHLEMPSGRLSLEDAQGGGVKILVMNDLDWLFPDDYRLWAHLRACVTERYRCFVIARRIALPTFAVLKAIGAFGIETYHIFVENKQLKDLEDHPLANIWPRYEAIAQATNHAFFRRLRATLTADRPPLIETPLLAAAFRHGLADEDGDESRTRALVRAAEAADLDESQAWVQHVRHYVAWESYQRPRQRKP